MRPIPGLSRLARAVTSSRRAHVVGLAPLAAAFVGIVHCAPEEGPPPATAAEQPPPQQVYAAAPVAQPAAAQPVYVTQPAYPAVQAGYPVTTVSAAPVTAVDYGRPPIPYSEFLAGLDNEGERQRLWTAFLGAERESRAFAPGNFVPVVRVESVQPDAHSGDWSPNGIIRMKPDGNAGLLFHELFHPAFHPSAFHLPYHDRDGAWSEAFCDAFRYYAERQFLPGPESRWQQGIDSLMAMSEAQALANPTFSLRKYTYPASLIVKRLGGPSGSIASLRALYFQLLAMRQQRGGPVLDSFFGFAPPVHKGDP